MAVKRVKTHPLLQLRLSIWHKKAALSHKSKIAAALTFRAKTLMNRALTQWRRTATVQKRIKQTRVKTTTFCMLHLQQRSLQAWMRITRQRQFLRDFVISRYSKMLLKCLQGLKSIKKACAIQAERKSQAEWLRAKTLMTKTMTRWKREIQQQRHVRKLQLFWNYWRRVHCSNVKERLDIERRVIARHLKCYYWGRLKRATRASKLHGIATLNYKCVLFSAWKAAFGATHRYQMLKAKAVSFHTESVMAREVTYRQSHVVFKVLGKYVDMRNHRRQGLALAECFASRQIAQRLVPLCFSHWRSFKLAALLDAHRASQVKEKAFKHLKQLAVVAREKHRLACLKHYLGFYKRTFAAWKFTSLTIRAPKKLAAKRYITSLLAKALQSWKADVFSIDVSKVATAMDFYDKNLMHRSIISWKLGLFDIARKKAKLSEVKWFRFNYEVRMLRRVFKAWKILHRVKLMLSVFVQELLSLHFYRWRRVVKFQGLQSYRPRERLQSSIPPSLLQVYDKA